VLLDFYVAALYDLRFTICGSYTEQVWPPLVYNIHQPVCHLCFQTLQLLCCAIKFFETLVPFSLTKLMNSFL